MRHDHAPLHVWEQKAISRISRLSMHTGAQSTGERTHRSDRPSPARSLALRPLRAERRREPARAGASIEQRLFQLFADWSALVVNWIDGRHPTH